MKKIIPILALMFLTQGVITYFTPPTSEICIGRIVGCGGMLNSSLYVSNTFNPPYLYTVTNSVYFNETALNTTISLFSSLFNPIAQDQNITDLHNAVLTNSSLLLLINGSVSKWDNLGSSTTIAQDQNITALWLNASNQNGRIIFLENNASNQDGRIIALEGRPLEPNIFSANVTDLNTTIDARNAVTYFNATSIYVTAGTLNLGVVSNTYIPFDGLNMNFTEAIGTPGLTIIANFTGVTDFTDIIRRAKYTATGHTMSIGLLNCGTGLYEFEYGTISPQSDFELADAVVLDPSNHICAGTVSIEFNEAANGNTNNHYSLDYINIRKGQAALSSVSHDGLSGRENYETNHPLYAAMITGLNNSLISNASVITTNTGNILANTQNITSLNNAVLTNSTAHVLKAGDTMTGVLTVPSGFMVNGSTTDSFSITALGSNVYNLNAAATIRLKAPTEIGTQSSVFAVRNLTGTDYIWFDNGPTNFDVYPDVLTNKVDLGIATRAWKNVWGYVFIDLNNTDDDMIAQAKIRNGNKSAYEIWQGISTLKTESPQAINALYPILFYVCADGSEAATALECNGLRDKDGKEGVIATARRTGAYTGFMSEVTNAQEVKIKEFDSRIKLLEEKLAIK